MDAKNKPVVTLSSAASTVLCWAIHTMTNILWTKSCVSKGCVGVHSVMPMQTSLRCLKKSRIHGHAERTFEKWICPFLKTAKLSRCILMRLFHRKQVYPVLACIHCRNTRSFSPWCYLKDETSKVKHWPCNHLTAWLQFICERYFLFSPKATSDSAVSHLP